MVSKIIFNEEKVDRGSNPSTVSPLVRKLAGSTIFKTTEGARAFLFFVILLMMVIAAYMAFNITPEEAINSPLAPPTI